MESDTETHIHRIELVEYKIDKHTMSENKQFACISLDFFDGNGKLIHTVKGFTRMEQTGLVIIPKP